MGRDIDDNPVYLAPNAVNLQLAMERWPTVSFHAIREHGQRLQHA
jgi:peptide chain release factor 3